MDDKHFDVVFRGHLAAGADEADVKAALARLFKSTPAQIERLFSGKRVVIKKNLDREQADKYREVLRNAGAKVSLVSSKAASATLAPVDSPAPPAQRASYAVDDPTEKVSQRASFATDDPAASEPGAADPVAASMESNAPTSPTPQDDFGQLSIAEVGATVDESARPPPVEIATEGLEAGEIDQALDQSEQPTAPDIATDHLQAAASDSQLDQSERPPEPQIDINHLSAEQVDEALDKAPKPPPVELDLSHLTLSE